MRVKLTYVKKRPYVDAHLAHIAPCKGHTSSQWTPSKLYWLQLCSNPQQVRHAFHNLLLYPLSVWSSTWSSCFFCTSLCTTLSCAGNGSQRLNRLKALVQGTALNWWSLLQLPCALRAICPLWKTWLFPAAPSQSSNFASKGSLHPMAQEEPLHRIGRSISLQFSLAGPCWICFHGHVG